MKKLFTKKLVLALLLFTGALMLPVSSVRANGNEWVFDEPRVISEETENYIKNLNENVFPTYKNKPQLGILFVNQLPSGCTIDEYKLEQFNLYGVGTAEENCGMLFVFSLTDRAYGFEIGDVELEDCAQGVAYHLLLCAVSGHFPAKQLAYNVNLALREFIPAHNQ